MAQGFRLFPIVVQISFGIIVNFRRGEFVPQPKIDDYLTIVFVNGTKTKFSAVQKDLQVFFSLSIILGV